MATASKAGSIVLPNLARGGRRLPGDPRRVAPQIFQAVEGALVAMKDVDHYFEVIENDPLAGGKPINGRRPSAVIFPQSRFNFVRDRFQLGFRAGRTDHEKISEAGNASQIENNNVFSFLVGSELGAGRS